MKKIYYSQKKYNMEKKFINKKPFFIAEISGNHSGKIQNAKKLIDTAKKSGASAVKLQTYTPDMMTPKSLNYKIKYGLWRKKICGVYIRRLILH